MKELKNTCCLHHIAGGWDWQGDPNCPGCSREWDYKPVLNLSNWGQRYSGLGSVIGSRFGISGTFAGYAVGSVIDMTNFGNLGENYKNSIRREINNGYLPAD